MEKRVLELLTSQGTLVSPETVNYILSKPEPEAYIQGILNKSSELPLFLTIEQLRSTEAKADAESSPTPTVESNGGRIDPAPDASETDGNARPEPIAPIQVPEPKVPKKPEATTDHEPVFSSAPETHATKSAPVIETNLTKRRPIASEYDGNVKILKDVTGQSTSEGSINDFVKYFRNRFETLRRILQHQRREVTGSTEISRVRSHQGPIKFIGLVNEIHETKNGHKILELEDETDSISVMINNSSPLITMSFVLDEVICVIGKLGKTDLVYVDDIIRPDVPIIKMPNKSEQPLACLFMADIHNGSNTFMHDTWEKFINWLNGKYSINGYDEQRDKIKYIVVAGDIVDGIGIYPNQESELEITDIYLQYEDLAKKLQDIPDHIQLIVQPGNHDAVRPAEPQPTFPQEITKLFNNDMIFVGNPCYFSIDSVEVLAYHGSGMDDFVMQIPEVNYNKPIQIMKEMLTRRHLAPVYGQRTAIAPEHLDYLLIDKIPDIFVTGHIHKTAVENFRDISLINASAWQNQTNYQKMRNFNPEPGKVILADLQSRRLNIISFV
ncbi:MAG: DNA-directed DNA polymerase II small subunit [Thermoplasmata archaeon]|nr:DNA-directed DNA polymerase II small subunit [Thermoplasmata archaeon]